ncbi:MAG: hypothetical protein AAFY10_11570 [Pseudomonadota bacterium]
MPAVTPDTLNWILGLVGLEAVILGGLMLRAGLARFVPALLAFLLSGAAMMIAVRLALSADGIGGAALAGWLAASGLGHIACLALAYRALQKH